MQEKKILYVSGEESAEQLKMRAQRLYEADGNSGRQLPENTLILCETMLESIFDNIRQCEPDIVIVDSIQTIYTETADSSPGSITQIRECTAALLRYAKQSATPVVLIGHITKEGSLAGPKILEHIVDAVIQFEGDQQHIYRILRAIKTASEVRRNSEYTRCCNAD